MSGNHPELGSGGAWVTTDRTNTMIHFGTQPSTTTTDSDPEPNHHPDLREWLKAHRNEGDAA